MQHHSSPGINLSNVDLQLGGHQVFAGLSMHMQHAKWHCVLGRSGVGKTSLLRLIAGLQSADNGNVQVDQATNTQQSIAYVPQEDSLLPWLTIEENVQLGPRLRGQANTQTRNKALALLEKVELANWSQALPASLSGGMRQRVALVRALLEEPDIVLMDEPFSRLDAITRHELQTLSLQLMKERTVVMVTHDPMEAVRLSHYVHVLQPGQTTHCASIELMDHAPRETDSQSAIEYLPQLWEQLGTTNAAASHA